MLVLGERGYTLALGVHLQLTPSQIKLTNLFLVLGAHLHPLHPGLRLYG